MMLNQGQYFLIALSEMISDENERADPCGGSAISEKRKRPVFQLGRPGYNRGEMPDAGNKVADDERPMADPIEPIMHQLDTLV